jgi:flagellar basal body P-ring formation protein FlgA
MTVMFEFEPDNSPRATLRRMLMLLAAALVMAFGIAARADSVRLYDQVGVQGAKVSLAQVAELQGPAARALGGVELATLKEAREQATISLDDVKTALDDAGVNWGVVSLRGYSACRVTRLAPPPAPVVEQGQAVAANIETPIDLGAALTLRQLVERSIVERAGVDPDGLRIRFSDRDARELDRAILGQSVEIEPTSLNTLGRVPLVVRLYEAGRVAETIRVSAKVQRVLLAVVAVAPIRRGEAFTRADLEVRECTLDDDSLTAITDPMLVVGQESAVSLRSGEVVFARSVRAPLMVRKGELVTVRCIVGGLVVRTVGRAGDNGSLDELIRVRNENTGEDIYAVVAGRNEAVVSTAAQPVQGTALTAADRDDKGATP